LTPQRKTLFYNSGDFSCKILANSSNPPVSRGLTALRLIM
jgi:hypothetical protein